MAKVNVKEFTKVGVFDESQIIKGEDKAKTKEKQEETGLKYIYTKTIKKKGVMFLEVYLVPTEIYLNSSMI